MAVEIELNLELSTATPAGTNSSVIELFSTSSKYRFGSECRPLR
jgi:hypothetical protein